MMKMTAPIMVKINGDEDVAAANFFLGVSVADLVLMPKTFFRLADLLEIFVGGTEFFFIEDFNGEIDCKFNSDFCVGKEVDF